MSDEHWYYLHENGSLIHKRTYPGDDNSPFVKHIWRCDTTDRMDAWTIILEGLALGATKERVLELAEKWECTPSDLPEFLARATVTPTLAGGAKLYLTAVGITPDQYWDWLASTPKGAKPDLATMPKHTMQTQEGETT